MVKHNWDEHDLVRLIRHEAVAVRSRHPWADPDDLESAGNEAVAEALARIDPGMEDGHYWNTVKKCVRDRMRDQVRRAARDRSRVSGLPTDADGIEVPVADVRTDDPGDRAGAIEAAGRLRMTTATVVRRSAPGPGEAAAHAAASPGPRCSRGSRRRTSPTWWTWCSGRRWTATCGPPGC